MAKITREDALEYHHLKGKPGKIEVVPTKPMDTQRDLSLAYSPGVAEPVLEIEKDAELAYEYTSKGNLVAVVSNGTAILGLGDRGALASKPVMEGKGVLFKKFADIDVFDIEVDSHDPDEIIKVVAAISPTFGGINLEDIKAPECFYIEEELKKMLNIPVFHDDQHGTAIISSAALANSLEIVGKKWDEIRLVISGAGASAISCAELAIRWGVKRENIMLCDSRGVVFKGRTEGMNKYKERFIVETDARDLADAVRGADVFYGLSIANVSYARIWSRAWLKARLSLPWLTLILRSNRNWRMRHARTLSSQPAVRIIQTRSITYLASRSFSAARWMFAPRPSMKR